MHRAAIFVATLLVCSACEPMRSSGVESTEPAESVPSTPEGETTVDEPAPDPTQTSDEPKEPEYQMPTRPAVDDKGVFSDLDDKVHLSFPSWIEAESITVVDHPETEHLLAVVGGTVVGYATPDMGEAKVVTNPKANDADGDGIPNQLDILIGAKKTAANAAPYKGGYKGMSYPGGDVPRTEGVCTDVVIRAVRNAGIDLQKQLHEDIKRAGSAYPMVDTPDTNIDQRRVKTLLPYFERQWDAKTTDIDEKGDWLPGDIVFMNTMRDERPDHLGIVSDRLGPSGYPMIINNWTNGYHTKPMDLLKFVPVTHHFRLPAESIEVADSSEP